MPAKMIRVNNFFDALFDILVIKGKSCAKIFFGTSCTMYGYDDEKDPYSTKRVWDSMALNSDIEDIYNRIVEAAKDIPSFKLCRLTKKANGYRFRFDQNLVSTYATKREVLNKIRGRVLNPDLTSTPCPANMPDVITVTLPPGASVKRVVEKTNCEQPNSSVKRVVEKTNCEQPNSSVKRVVEKTNKEKKMNDFSLTNLKNAIINKVTTLDKKTITIIGILILLLLIATRYQDIKDILVGIKDKVKRSKNFKAMMADGEKAVESLKKIVGVKSTGKDNSADE